MKKTKDQVQSEAEQAILDNEGQGMVLMATGTGKSKIPIDIAKRDYHKGYSILICVPTEKLRDVNWKAEFTKWGAESIWDECVERTCYVSMPKIMNKHYDLVVLDEGHNITENNSQFFSNNTYDGLVLLTATMPTDPIKLRILDDLRLKIVYTVTMDQAVEWGLISPYKITIVETELEKVRKTVMAGSKKKPFLQTEQAAYAYITNQINSLTYEDWGVEGAVLGQRKSLTSVEQGRLQMLILKRMHLIYNLQSKLDAAKFLLSKIPRPERTLIFAGSIKHAEELCSNSFHSKSKKTDTSFDDFCDKKITRLSCVDSLNEGHNIPDLDRALIVQLNSKSLKMIQRIGRIVRFREGHIARIVIIVVKGTMDAEWARKSLSEFSSDNITTLNFNDLKARYS